MRENKKKKTLCMNCVGTRIIIIIIIINDKKKVLTKKKKEKARFS